MSSAQKGLPTKAAKLRAGFTLIELLIVISLIAILALGGLIVYRLQMQKGYDAIRKRDLRNIKIAFEHYFSDHGCYPPANILDNCGGDELQPYLDKIPCDPETNQPYTVDIITAGTCVTKYFVSANLDNVNDPQVACNGKYIITSANVTEYELSLNCTGESFCQAGFYGCISGSCTLISAASKPSCYPLFCTSNCQNSCSIDNDGNGQYDFELSPQPCNP